MRRITQFTDETAALGFITVLEEDGIEGEMMSSGDQYQVWVIDDDHVGRAKELLQKFNNSPAPVSRNEFEKHQSKKPKSEPPRQIDVRTEVWGRQESSSNTLTMILMFFSCVCFLCIEYRFATEYLGYLFYGNPFGFGGMLRPGFADILNGEIWRLVTPIFIHFNWIHIIFNMIWLYQLGVTIETVENSKKLLLLVLVVGALSNTAEYVVSPRTFGGMSGVIYGLLGYIWGKGRWEMGSPYHIDKGTFGFMMVWLVLCFFGIFGPVANFAHLGGLVAGTGWSYLEAKRIAGGGASSR